MNGTEIIVAKVLPAASKYGLTRLTTAIDAYLHASDNRFAAAWEIERRDHVIKKLFWLEKALTELQTWIPQLAEMVDSQINDPQLHRVWDNFVYESVREAMAERKVMLAAADAGIVDPRLSIQQKARVERTLRHLDPDDVRALYGINRMAASKRKRYETWSSLFNGDILVSTGCLRLDPLPIAGFGGVGVPEIALTPLGNDILRVLALYLRDRGANFEVPGRHPEPDENARNLAWTELGRIQGFRQLVDRIKRAGCNTSYKYSADPPTATVYCSDVRQVAELKAGMEDINASGDAMVQFRFQADVDSAQLEMTASRHLLRIVADELDASWS